MYMWKMIESSRSQRIQLRENERAVFFGVAVRPATGTVRPGDDFRFRIGLLDYSEVAATASPGDFVAVYDKKLLWRADFYIDEGGE